MGRTRKRLRDLVWILLLAAGCVAEVESEATQDVDTAEELPRVRISHLDAGADGPTCGPDAPANDAGLKPVCRVQCVEDPTCDDGDPCTDTSRCGGECQVFGVLDGTPCPGGVCYAGTCHAP